MDESSSRQPSIPTVGNPAELALEIYNLLLPHESSVRVRAITATLALLGESAAPQLRGAKASPGDLLDQGGDFSDLKLGSKATKWIQKHGLKRSMLEEVFHLSESPIEVIASQIPGDGRREMTVNCYLLVGICGLLNGDAAVLNDGEAISLCKRLAAYDKNNHTTYRQAVGNKMTGTKPNFTLTGPGESAAADLIKQMTAPTNI